ncbi:hypothetical protein MMC14_010457 [Varicellaria rhodocarpa]|nr:hypothetical protein [Varicellaria rhodocarpa]
MAVLRERLACMGIMPNQVNSKLAQLRMRTSHSSTKQREKKTMTISLSLNCTVTKKLCLFRLPADENSLERSNSDTSSGCVKLVPTARPSPVSAVHVQDLSAAYSMQCLSQSMQATCFMVSYMLRDFLSSSTQHAYLSNETHMLQLSCCEQTWVQALSTVLQVNNIARNDMQYMLGKVQQSMQISPAGGKAQRTNECKVGNGQANDEVGTGNNCVVGLAECCRNTGPGGWAAYWGEGLHIVLADCKQQASQLPGNTDSNTNMALALRSCHFNAGSWKTLLSDL